MCRIAAHSGAPVALEDVVIRPPHSLLTQSQRATEAKLAVNGDGFGIAWYGDQGAPGIYRDVLPAWADDNLLTLCRMVRSHHFIAHIRASTVGETARANCHPFAWGRWAFCHNGQVPHFPAIRRQLEAALPDDLYAHRRGTTDSEMLFLTLLANGLEDDPRAAFLAMLALIGPPRAEGPVRLTTVFSDGDALYGLRHASDRLAPTLYLSEPLPRGGRQIASEPLCGRAAHWQMLPPDTLCRVAADGTVSLTPLYDEARLSA